MNGLATLTLILFFGIYAAARLIALDTKNIKNEKEYFIKW